MDQPQSLGDGYRLFQHVCACWRWRRFHCYIFVAIYRGQFARLQYVGADGATPAPIFSPGLLQKIIQLVDGGVAIGFIYSRGHERGWVD